MTLTRMGQISGASSQAFFSAGAMNQGRPSTGIGEKPRPPGLPATLNESVYSDTADCHFLEKDSLVKRHTRALALISAVAATAVVLSGCAYVTLATKVSTKADGNISLSSYHTSDYLGLGDFIPTGPQITPGGSRGTAKVELDASFDGGNWNINGTYRDGAVRFTFKGFSLLDLYSNIRTKADQDVSQIPTTTSTGGTCQSFTSNYLSTNAKMPGTGLVKFVVCDAPGSRSGESPTWQGPDYIQVFIPESRPGMDANPYANYLSGGKVTGRERSSGVTNSKTVPSSIPDFTPTPTWPAPPSVPADCCGSCLCP